MSWNIIIIIIIINIIIDISTIIVIIITLFSFFSFHFQISNRRELRLNIKTISQKFVTNKQNN